MASVERAEGLDERAAPRSSRTPRILVAAAVVVPISFLFVAAVLLEHLESGRPEGLAIAGYSAPAVKVSGRAPGFSLPDLHGVRTLSLQELSGHVVVLTFWASWCSPCRREAPALASAWERYRPMGVRFLGVDHKDARPAAISFARDQGIPYPSAFDSNGSVAARYGLFGLPTTVVIGADGRMVYRITGRVDHSNLSRALAHTVRSGG